MRAEQGVILETAFSEPTTTTARRIFLIVDGNRLVDTKPANLLALEAVLDGEVWEDL